MRQLKTPEEIIQEQVGIKPGADRLTPMDYGECKAIIIAAQRDALECVAENVTIKMEFDGADEFKSVEVNMESILNLLPKE